MTGKRKSAETGGNGDKLRLEAEGKIAGSGRTAALLKKQGLDKLVHELQVHQVELEMQNKELRRTQAELQLSKERYFDLYDIAPVGYFRLSEKGTILEANLTGSNMLGMVPADVRARRFAAFICNEDQDTFYRHRSLLFETRSPQSLELRMARRDGSLMWALVEATLAQDAVSGKPVCLVTMSDITALKRAEHKLSQNEEKYHIVADFTYDWEYWVSPRGRYIYVSPSCKDHTGFDVADFMKDPGLMLKIVHPDDAQAFLLHRKEAHSAGGANDPLDFRIVTRGGEERWIAHRCRKVFGAGGNFLGVRGSNRDITKSKDYEKALAESNQKFRNVFDNSAIGKSITSLDGIVNVNRAMADLLGYTLEEMAGLRWQDVTNPDDLAEHKRLLEPVRSGKEASARFVKRYLHKDGSVIWADASVVLQRDDQGVPLYYITSVMDITERKRTEEAMQRSRLLLRDVVDSTPDWIYVKDAQHRYLLVNRSFAAAQNLTPGEMVDRPDTDFFPGELCLGDPQKGITGFHQDDDMALQGNTMHNPRYTVPWADGTMHIYDTYKIPLADQAGKIYAVLVYARDMTSQRRAEDERQVSFVKLQKVLHDAIRTMAKIVEMRDPYTAGHQDRVAQLAAAIARKLELDDDRVDHLLMAASIHDVGKMYVPSDILNKPGRLSQIEFSLIKTHVQGGYDILRGLEFSQPVALMVLQHHERLDGSGYPNGLKGGDILLEGRILAVADVVEAMSSHRPYRPTLGLETALEEISRCRGTLFDPDVVDACRDILLSGSFQFKALEQNGTADN